MSPGRAADLLEANQRLLLGIIAAQDEAAHAEQALRDFKRMPRLDALVGSPNGALLFDRLTHALAVAKRSGEKLGLLVVSIENLDTVKDTMGFARGEEVIQLASRRLGAAVRGSDLVSRYGDHEFLVLLTGLAQAGDALMVADATVAAMALPMQVGGREVRLKASIGISVYPDDGSDGGALMDRATAAMYHARRDGLGTHFFRNEASTDARSLELRSAEALNLPGHVAAASAADTADVQMRANEELLMAALRAHELLAAAELAYRRQTEFMGVVAHELRGPLAPLSNAAALLGLSRESVPLAKGIIERQVVHLSRLVADLIDVARVNTGKMRLDIQRLDLREVLRDCADAARPAMEECKQHLKVELPAAETLVNGDRTRLTQIFRNLLENASKYTPKGGNIALAVTRGTDRAIVTVTDNGIGISAETLPHIFDRFAQEGRATAFDGSGLGIGLALVRELVEAHDGTVIAESAGPGCGSRFTVSLPLLASRA